MNATCCSPSAAKNAPSACPISASPGKPVEWLTVAALTAGRIPARQDFWLCRDPVCEVVYFGSSGALLTGRHLTVMPGFKNGGDGVVCYCFQHRRSDLARDLAETGSTGILQAIKDEVRAGNCACEVRNPSGKCCLGEVQKAISELEREMEVSV